MSMKTTNEQTVKEVIKKAGIEFYVTIISAITIFALALCDMNEKKLKIELAKIGLIQKVDGSKVVWTKP